MPCSISRQAFDLASTARKTVDYFFAISTLALAGLVVATIFLPLFI